LNLNPNPKSEATPQTTTETSNSELLTLNF